MLLMKFLYFFIFFDKLLSINIHSLTFIIELLDLWKIYCFHRIYELRNKHKQSWPTFEKLGGFQKFRLQEVNDNILHELDLI